MPFGPLGAPWGPLGRKAGAGAIFKIFRVISGSFPGDFREIPGGLEETILAPKLQPKMNQKIDGFLEPFGARLGDQFWSKIRLKNMVKNRLIF